MRETFRHTVGAFACAALSLAACAGPPPCGAVGRYDLDVSDLRSKFEAWYFGQLTNPNRIWAGDEPPRPITEAEASASASRSAERVKEARVTLDLRANGAFQLSAGGLFRDLGIWAGTWTVEGREVVLRITQGKEEDDLLPPPRPTYEPEKERREMIALPEPGTVRLQCHDDGSIGWTVPGFQAFNFEMVLRRVRVR